MTVKELISILEKLPETWLVGTGDFDENDADDSDERIYFVARCKK